jgi:hypothetical protein
LLLETFNGAMLIRAWLEAVKLNNDGVICWSSVQARLESLGQEQSWRVAIINGPR